MTRTSEILPALSKIPARAGEISCWVSDSWETHRETVVCLHGFPDTCYSFASQMEPLVQAGFNVLIPVLRGYEPSRISPCEDYFLVSLVDDLLALLDAVGIARAHVVGHDWGAAIAWMAGHLAPHRLLTLSALAIPPLSGLAHAIRRHPSQLGNSWYMGFFQLRGMADRVVAADHGWFVERLWCRWSPQWAFSDEDLQPVLDAFAQPGVVPAALGYYRCLFRLSHPKSRQGFSLLRQVIPVPVLALAGEQDGCMSSLLYDDAVLPHRYPGGIRVEILPGCGHFLHREKPDEVNEQLIAFLLDAEIR